MPIRPASCRAKPTWWAASHSPVAVRSTPGSPRPACGAAIQPASTSGVRMTSPVTMAAHAAIAPVTTSGRTAPGRSSGSSGSWGRAPGRAGAVTCLILATGQEGAAEARRAGRRWPGPRPRRCGGWGSRCQRDPSSRRPGVSVAPHDLADEQGRAAGGPAHADAHLLQRLLLRLRGAGGAGDDRPGVAHGLALGRGEPGHVGDHRLADALLDVGGGPLLRVPADLADHDDRI